MLVCSWIVIPLRMHYLTIRDVLERPVNRALLARVTLEFRMRERFAPSGPLMLAKWLEKNGFFWRDLEVAREEMVRERERLFAAAEVRKDLLPVFEGVA